MSYLSFTFKLNEKKVPLKRYGLETGDYWEVQNLRGGLEIYQKKEGLTKKGLKKFKEGWL